MIRVVFQTIAQLNRCVTCALRVILVGDWGAEQRHDAVAGVLINRAFVAVDPFGQNGEEVIQDPVPFLRADLAG